MKKSELRKKIEEYISGQTSAVKDIFFYDDKFAMVENGVITDKSLEDITPHLTPDVTLWSLQRDKRTFDIDKGAWIGEEPSHRLPEGLPRCKIVNVTCAGDGTLETFMELRGL